MSARRVWHWALLLAVALGSAFAARPALAHPTPGSWVFLDLALDGARLEQNVPLEELERALGRRLVQDGEPAASAVQRHAELLGAYAASHIGASSVDGGQAWQVTLRGVSGQAAADGPRALFVFELSAPPNGGASTLRLHDDVVAHQVVSHYTSVYVRSDWESGVRSAEPRLVGVIHAGRFDVTVPRHGSFGRGLRSVIGLGMEHIATGTDHLLFLFALVLVAPVLAVAGRWRAPATTRAALAGIARVVTAFSIGHSATLALGVLGGVTLAEKWVEPAIALSILVAAVHALRPLFPRREPLVAGLFGLVHGLAFATTLAEVELGRAQALWTLFGFNLGIELAQLGLLGLVLPWLLLLARGRGYGLFRVIGAGLAVALAGGWLLERTAGITSPFGAPLAWLEAHALALPFALALGACVARFALGPAPRVLEGVR